MEEVMVWFGKTNQTLIRPWGRTNLKAKPGQGKPLVNAQP